MGREGEHRFLWGPRPHASHCKSSTELWAPLCKAMFARWGEGRGGRGKGNSVSLCENSDGGSEANNPNPYPVPLSGFLGGSPSLHLLPHVFPILYLSVHPLLGGPSPSLLQAPRGGGGSLEGMCGLYGFIYNILKKSKICMKKYQIAPLSPIPGFCPFFLFKKRNKTHFCTGRGRDREGVWQSH